jgi:DNA-binding MarR family transcriptional regulator
LRRTPGGAIMTTAERTSIINDFLASMHIFSSAIDELMAAQLEDELGGELTIPQLKLLKLVARTETESISEIAAFLGVSNAAASKAVDRLARRDLIERIESADDRRATQLSLTVKGTFLLKRYEDVQNRVLEGLFRQFMPEDFIETAELLDQLSADLVDRESGPRELCFRCGIYFRDKCALRNVNERTCYYNLKRRPKDHGQADANEGR